MILFFLFFFIIVSRSNDPWIAHAVSNDQGPGQGKKVLVLCSYGYSLPTYQSLNRALLLEMKNGGVGTNDIFFEYLDFQHIQKGRQRQALADMLRAKYTNLGIDLVITLHSPAMSFLRKEAAGIFLEIPIVFWDLQQEPLPEDDLKHWITRAAVSLDVKGTMERAMELFPDTAQVIFVSGSAENDRSVENVARRDLSSWEDKLQVEYLTNSSVEEILGRVADLPPRSIVIYGRLLKDRTGRSFTPSDVGNDVANAANVPVFCLYDTHIGGGMVGGSLLSFEAEGSRVGQIVLDVLSGKISPGEEPTTMIGKPVHMFDWRQINKWAGKANNLPEETVFLHRPPALWPDHAWQIIVVVVILLAQLLLIGSLLMQRRLRKQAEEELRAANATLEQRVTDRTAQLQKEKDRYYTLFNSMTEGFALNEIVYGAAGKTDYRFLEINPAFERLTGLSRERLVGKTVREVSPDIENYLIQTYSRVALDGDPVYFENYSASTNRWYEVYAFQTRNETFAVFFNDITVRKQAEKALRESEKRLNRAQEIAHLGSWELDLRKNELIWSDEVYRIFGLMPREFSATYEGFLAQVHPDDRTAVDQAYTRSLQAGIESYEIEHRIVRKSDGATRCVFEKCQHERDEEGRVIRSLGMVQDITERKKTEQELKRSNQELEHQLGKIEELNRSLQATNTLLEEKRREVEIAHKHLLHTEKLSAIGKLSASIAHELKNPLQGIFFFLKGLKNLEKLDGEESVLLDTVIDESIRIKNLLRNLQDFNRPSSGRKQFVNVHESLDALLLLMKSDFHGRQISVVRTYAKRLPSIMAVADQVKQVFLNLLTNPAQACRQQNKVITISTRQEGDRVAVAISDTGIGIEPADIEQIFQPFFTTKSDGVGTGLGLSISYDIIRKHQGDIMVDSRPGQGTTFTVLLPVTTENGTTSQIPSTVDLVLK